MERECRANYLLVDSNLLEINDMTGMGLIKELERYILAFVNKINATTDEDKWKIFIDKDNSHINKSINNNLTKLSYKGIKSKVSQIKMDRFILFNEEQNIEQMWDLTEKKIIIVFNDSTDAYYVIQDIYASIRILTNYIISQYNSSILHGTAVTYDSKGILIVGNKGSGKSTLTSALLMDNCKLVAVDRCLIWEQNQNYNIAGWISTYRVDEKSLNISLNKDMVRTLIDYKKQYITDKKYTVDKKFRYPTYDFLKMLNRDPQHQARLTSILILGEWNNSNSILEEIHVSLGKEYIKKHIIEFELPFCKGKRELLLENANFQHVKFYRLNRRKEPVDIANEIIRKIK